MRFVAVPYLCKPLCGAHLGSVRTVSLMNPYLDPDCTGGFTPWLMHQGSVDASTRGGNDTYLLERQLNGKLALADSLKMAARVGLAIIQSADEALRNLNMFAFLALHLLSAGR